ncbi:uncharacterized protein F5Z01DRAFT_654781 [Emericellopsis atlantica]|uniref:Tse2 ADP-ribosyltransferase toxin domain-containing protein n=1 Tax=Emericellopsis atlantica TaxID=2614577 RepID=A0A9P7ZNI7_9HYPO|nr:uncharacterized protein F5Z01DRAFT_654781 [Emericellopsis atlantica]KAG9254763.1 hypothetical protein F5Z01DRAFT_654781 [Emericellopsis atlantica]
MISSLRRPFIVHQQSRLLSRRLFSVKAIYSSFPTTLHYYSPRYSSSLLNHREIDDRPDGLYEEGVIVGQHGLVYPGVTGTSVSNGAVMFPNTFMMQELARRHFNENLDREDEGKQVETPFIYTIPRGTQIPSDLILFNDYISQFSLQPSRGMPLADLNHLLDEFYNRHAQKESAETWFDAHPYQNAMADDADDVWMTK